MIPSGQCCLCLTIIYGTLVIRTHDEEPGRSDQILMFLLTRHGTLDKSKKLSGIQHVWKEEYFESKKNLNNDPFPRLIKTISSLPNLHERIPGFREAHEVSSLQDVRNQAIIWYPSSFGLP